MKQTIFTILLLSVIGLVSCRKKGVEINIRQYDSQQIQNYMAQHGLTGKMTRDTTGGDTSGMYYQVIVNPKANATVLADTSKISMVFTLSTFDGNYTSTDTINNHYDEYVGHITTGGLPAGLRLALLNDLKKNGGSIRVLIPSRMAYGLYGTGSGSKLNVNSHIAGNQCLDYYAHLITDQNGYDKQVIKNYMKNQNLTGYDTTAAGLFYKVTKKGTGTKVIDSNSVVEVTYTGMLLNNTIFDSQYNGADSISFMIPNLIKGVQQGLSHGTDGGTFLSMIMTSSLGYGTSSVSSIPVNSCLRFDYEIYSVTP